MTPDHRPSLKPRLDVPFSRPIDVDRMPETGLETDIEASESECAAIAAESGLPAVGALSAHFRVERRGSSRFEVTGTLKARITQTCVVSLEPFETAVVQPMDLSFVQLAPPPAERSRRRTATAAETRQAKSSPPQADADLDAPDPIVDGIIDLGAVAYEFLMLARDLYPRKPGVAFTDTIVGDDDDTEPSAFAALQRLKDRP